MRLKHVLLICFLSLSALPLGLSIWIVHSQSTEQYREQMSNKLVAVSALAKHRLLTAVERIRDNTKLIASRTQLRRQIGLYGQTQSIGSLNAINRILRDANINLPDILNIAVYDANLNAITSSRLKTELMHPTLQIHEKFDVVLLREEELKIRSIRKLQFEGEDVGYVSVDFSANFILDLVNQTAGLGQTGEWLFAVRDQDGAAVFAMPLKYDADAAFNRKVPSERTDVPIVQALRGNEIVMHHVPDYMEEPVLASTRYLQTLDWGLVAKINEAELASTIREANKYLLSLGLVIIAVAAVAAFWVSAMIARPIEKLTASTRRVISGDFEYEPVEANWREAGDLAESFGQMSESLSDLRDHLQDKVTERTRELNKVNEKLKEISIRDPLTGLFNRRYVMDRLDEEFKRTRRYNGRLAVAMLDLDHFKKVNDTHGHGAGDEVLIGMAFCVQHTVRATDIFGRVGGEEFCIVIPEADEAGTRRLLERIRTEIEALPFKFGKETVPVTCSIGAAFIDEEMLSSMALIECADKALYHAKATGRNKLVVCNDIPCDDLKSQVNADTVATQTGLATSETNGPST
jgi:diguanylate cyclase (GGDEF)-like protein